MSDPLRKFIQSNSFSDIAGNVIDLTPKAAARFRQHYLNRSSVEVSDDLIGCSGTSEVFRGRLEGRAVAVKRLRMDVIKADPNLRELKDLVTEIDFMCRLSPGVSSIVVIDNIRSLESSQLSPASPGFAGMRLYDLQESRASAYCRVPRSHRRLRGTSHGSHLAVHSCAPLRYAKPALPFTEWRACRQQEEGVAGAAA